MFSFRANLCVRARKGRLAGHRRARQCIAGEKKRPSFDNIVLSEKREAGKRTKMSMPHTGAHFSFYTHCVLFLSFARSFSLSRPNRFHTSADCCSELREDARLFSPLQRPQRALSKRPMSPHYESSRWVIAVLSKRLCSAFVSVSLTLS